MKPIRQEDRGEHVVDVQNRLSALGFDVASEERSSGSFEQKTADAVRAFQQARGLLVDGIVGRETWRELVEASWRLGDRVLYLRAPHLRGDDVRELQERLATFGFDVGRPDGIFGPRTDAAMREFQRNYGIPPDGVVGARTLRALRGLPPIAGETGAAQLREREALRPRAGLTGLRVVIDPGHGGEDPGFVGPGGAREDELCFSVGRRLEAGLADVGAHVFLTRHEADGPDDSDRAALANALEADVFLGVHAGGPDERVRGATAFYFGRERFRSDAGMRLAELLLEAIGGLGIDDLRAHPKTFTVLRETRMPAVVVELGQVTDADEERLLIDPSFQDRLAAAILGALARYARAPVPA